VLALETGMCQGELMTLTWPGVDLERRIVTLTDTKSGEGRAVPLSKRAVKTKGGCERSWTEKAF
jgi:integrase